MITIKEKKIADRESSQDVLNIMKDVYGQSPWTLDQIEADMAREDSYYLMIYENETVLGFLAIQETLFEREISQIAVKKAYQGQGLASQLLATVGLEKDIFLEVRLSNLGAQLFYQKNGFKEIARRPNYYHEPVEDAIIMKRECNER